MHVFKNTQQICADFQKKKQKYLEKKLEECETLLIIGGGVVGTEFAAELAFKFYLNDDSSGKRSEADLTKKYPKYPKKKIILVQSGGRLLSRLPAVMHDLAFKKFKEWGVDVRLGERVAGFDPTQKQFL